MAAYHLRVMAKAWGSARVGPEGSSGDRDRRSKTRQDNITSTTLG